VRIPVIIGAIVLAAIAGAANNALNPRHLDWIGSPRVIDEPFDVDRAPHVEGVKKAVAYAWKGLKRSSTQVAIGAAAAIAISLAWRALRRQRWSGILGFWFRAGTAAMFLAACWYKLTDPPSFAKAVAQYRLLPAALVGPFALWLPAFEAVVAVGLLLLPWWRREFYALAALLWALFIVALGWALSRRLGIACGCFGIADVPASVGETWFSLLRDVVFFVPTLVLSLLPRPRRPSPASSAGPAAG
jgi:hypothetical protein